jgi:hypothetical protein
MRESAESAAREAPQSREHSRAAGAQRDLESTGRFVVARAIAGTVQFANADNCVFNGRFSR